MAKLKINFETKQAEVDYWADKLEEHFNSGALIQTKDKTITLELQDGTQFKQCWADTPERKLFPSYWFVSNESDEHLLSVRKKRIIYVPKNYREDGSAYYIFSYEDENGVTQHRHIEAHNLVWLTWGAKTYGKATQLLEEKGINAFGVATKEKDVLNGHHIDEDHDNNAPTNGRIVTYRVHKCIHSAPPLNAEDKQKTLWVLNFAKTASEENPNSPTILFTGEHGKSIDTMTFEGGTRDIMAIDETLDKETADKLQRMNFFVVGMYLVTH